ncbi:copper chaperone PCu(A)C [Persephonella sp. KM09-Lau-8]|uniref:copper chaperone PCu(A)C n=1 Tax=Persephonella sp. KM09-Lau-8 TaxID=1158345 RepID=UPI00049623E2|nr:copper chaperone PCu(A)C [Persephonella sp. KM09-Lau-8]
MRKIAAFLLTGLVSCVLAAPEIIVKDPWVRAVPPTMKNTALFMVIENKGDAEDSLIDVKTEICNQSMIHKTENSNGVMKMVHVEKVVIPPKSTVVFKPGGFHVMLMGLKNPIKPGQMLKFTLIFEKTGAKTIEAPVKMK